MYDEVKRSRVIAGLAWKIFERMGVQGGQFVIQIVLARLLLPSDYGTVALITSLIAISNVLVQSGLAQALIQKDNADEKDFSTAFFASLLISTGLYFLLFICAPTMSLFYSSPVLVPIIRVQSITLIFAAVSSVQTAYLQRNMEFKKTFTRSLGWILTQGVVGISLAYSGFGVWALVLSQLAATVVGTALLWFTLDWKPSLQFSFQRLSGLFAFGWRIMVSGLLDSAFLNIHSLSIGKVYSREVLGFYNRGQNIPSILSNLINNPIVSVMFPTLASCKGDKTLIKRVVRRSTVTACFFVFPLMVGLAAASKPLIILLLGDKWLPSVPFMQLSCITFSFWPIIALNAQVSKAVGRPDLFLVVEVLKKLVTLSILFATLNLGVYKIMAGGIAASFFSLLLSSFPNQRILSYTIKEQISDVGPSALLSIATGVVIYYTQMIFANPVLSLAVQACAGSVFYLFSAFILKFECLSYLLAIRGRFGQINRRVNA